jgi:hypothetical protein
MVKGVAAGVDYQLTAKAGPAAELIVAPGESAVIDAA